MTAPADAIGAIGFALTVVRSGGGHWKNPSEHISATPTAAAESDGPAGGDFSRPARD